MTKKPVPELGPLEFKLLQILWKHQSLTAPQALEAYNRQAKTKLAYTTVMTLLGRLADKGVLKVNRERQPYKFSAAVTRDQMLRHRVREFVNMFFEGEPFDLAIRLVEETPLSDDSVDKLQNVLRERKSKTKTKTRL